MLSGVSFLARTARTARSVLITRTARFARTAPFVGCGIRLPAAVPAGAPHVDARDVPLRPVRRLTQGVPSAR